MNKTSKKSILNIFNRSTYLAVALAMLLVVLLPTKAFAAQVTSRSLSLSTSAGNTAATWAFTFTPSVTTALNGITFQVCDAASGTCNIPGSWTNGSSSFTSLTYNGSSQSGWTLDNAVGYLRIKNNSSAATATGPIVATFGSVTNPNTTNETFYVRILTYTGDDYTSGLDSGVVAASTSQQITVTASVDESLTFCTGTSGVSTSSCSGATGSTVALGTLSSSSTASSTSQFGVGTNGTTGFIVTVNGSTLTSGGNTVSALASQTAASTGTEQFGINLKDNATPNVGAEADGSGTATASATYGTADQYRFVSGDTVASKNGTDVFRRFTVSYIANITTATEAGSYSTTLTYIATATF